MISRVLKMILSNLDASRDWGHATDYVNAMLLIMNLDKPDDFVVQQVRHILFKSYVTMFLKN